MRANSRPPAPKVRLRIGVSGHRVPPKLPQAAEGPLRTRVDRILSTIIASARSLEGRFPWSQAVGERAEFVVVSSLAEGADRLVAEAGLAAGCSLEVVLPLPRAEYARDFNSDDSRAVFAELLGRASAVFELDGLADQRARAYKASGLMMLSNVDLLIAIWDGEEAAGVGGTAQIVDSASDNRIPVIRLDPRRMETMEVAWPQQEATASRTFRPIDQDGIARLTKDILSPPSREAPLRKYLAETERRWNFCQWYPLLLVVFSARFGLASSPLLRPALPDTVAKWSRYFDCMPADRSQRLAMEKILLPAFSAADHLSVFYSLVYRSAFVFNFLFAAIAVALALGGIFVSDASVKGDIVAAELVIIFAILGTYRLGKRREWHRRSLEYRRLAECLRHLRILAPLGISWPLGAAFGDDDREDWVDWYVGAIRRQLPLPDLPADGAYVRAVAVAVRSAEIADQAAYHAVNAERLALVERRMHHVGQTLFALTATLCVAFLLAVWLNFLPRHDAPAYEIVLKCLTFLTALLPTLGAALGAIGAQSDFASRAEQSARTGERLRAIDQMLDREPVPFSRLAELVQKASDVMIADLQEWQTVFRARPLSLPA